MATPCLLLNLSMWELSGLERALQVRPWALVRLSEELFGPFAVQLLLTCWGTLLGLISRDVCLVSSALLLWLTSFRHCHSSRDCFPWEEEELQGFELGCGTEEGVNWNESCGRAGWTAAGWGEGEGSAAFPISFRSGRNKVRKLREVSEGIFIVHNRVLLFLFCFPFFFLVETNRVYLLVCFLSCCCCGLDLG